MHLPINMSIICHFGITPINRNYTSANCPRTLSFYRGTACTGSASCSCPRINLYLHGAALHDPPPLLVYICLAADTPHRSDAHAGMLCLRSAMRRWTLVCLQGVCIQDAEAYALYNTSVRIQQAYRSRDACTVSLVCTA